MVKADEPPIEGEQEDQQPLEPPNMLGCGNKKARPNQKQHIHAEKDQQAFNGRHHHERDGKAIEHFTFSISLNSAQPEVFKKLFELNSKIRRPIKSFDYIRLYLSKNESDIVMRYRSLILAKRSPASTNVR